MSAEHICEVCFQPFDEHEDDHYWPPRCCHGCPCGSGDSRPDPKATE